MEEGDGLNKFYTTETAVLIMTQFKIKTNVVNIKVKGTAVERTVGGRGKGALNKFTREQKPHLISPVQGYMYPKVSESDAE